MVTILSQVLDDTQDPKDTIRIFLHQFVVGDLLRKCRAHNFKTCKQYLKMLKECNSPSFDAFTCHLAIVAVRYMILSVRHRESSDDRTIGDLFWLFTAEVSEITFILCIAEFFFVCCL